MCSVEKIVVTNLDFQPCMEMMFCKEHETCIMDDDMQAMYQKFRKMDSLIIATPVMTMGVPGKLKLFFRPFLGILHGKVCQEKIFFHR